MAPPSMRDSAVSPCFRGCLAFLHRHFAPQTPPSPSLHLSLHSQQRPSPWGPSTIPTIQLPATEPSRGPVTLSGLSMAAARTLFMLPQISCFTLSLECFSSDSDNCLDVGIKPLLLFSHPLRASPVLRTLLFFPSSFVLPSFAWFYIFFSSGQVLLSSLSWCSACISVSEGVFLLYPWREMYSTSTYSSTILFSSR